MKDQLLDIVKHTYSLGIDLVKVTGTDKETLVTAISEDRSAVVEGKFTGPVAEFIGVFGMPNLGKLNTILNISEYQEDAKLTILYQEKEGNKMPAGVHFENKAGDFKNDYRFMTAEIINEKLKTVKFKGAKWGVEFEPTVVGVQRLKFQCQANSEETTFTAKVEKGNLHFYFGDHSRHAGNFIFAPGVTGNLTKTWSWPVTTVLNILALSGDKIFRISDEGAAQITVSSGLSTWTYTIPAQTK